MTGNRQAARRRHPACNAGAAGRRRQLADRCHIYSGGFSRRRSLPIRLAASRRSSLTGAR
jgi:hypothetical protein